MAANASVFKPIYGTWAIRVLMARNRLDVFRMHSDAVLIRADVVTFKNLYVVTGQFHSELMRPHGPFVCASGTGIELAIPRVGITS